MVKMYEQEKAESLNIIKGEVLVAFLYSNVDELVGRKPNGDETTLRQEVAEVARLTHLAYVNDGVNYFNARKAFRDVELTEEEKQNRRNRLYISAGKKILFLSSVSKLLTGHKFVSGKFDHSSVEDMKRLADAFEWCVAHYEDVISATY